MAGVRTEFAFALPKGWVDGQDVVHRDGVMRLATARDEFEALADPAVPGPDAPELTIILLSRVIVRLGDAEGVTPQQLYNFFAADLAYLQDVYGAINYGTEEEIRTVLGEPQTLAPLSMAAVTPLPKAILEPDPEPVGMPETLGADQLSTVTSIAPEPEQPTEPSSAEVAADEDDDESPARPVLKGRRARIEEVGKVSGPRAGGG